MYVWDTCRQDRDGWSSAGPLVALDEGAPFIAREGDQGGHGPAVIDVRVLLDATPVSALDRGRPYLMSVAEGSGSDVPGSAAAVAPRLR
jgi:hypothetical protein